MLWLSIGAVLLGLFVGWLARYRHRKQETKIRALKGILHEEIKKTCEAAKKGDSEASLRLEAFKESITEQSVRMHGRPKPPTTIIQGGL